MGKLVLGYWKTRGLAQHIRHLLAYVGADFEEVQYEAREKWFEEDKKNLGFDFPNMPYLIDGDYKLTESVAVIKYISKSFKPELLGKNIRDQGLVENILGVWTDYQKALAPLFGTQDPAAVAAALEKIKPKFNQLKDYVGGKDFALGYVTVVDFVMAEGLYYF